MKVELPAPILTPPQIQRFGTFNLLTIPVALTTVSFLLEANTSVSVHILIISDKQISLHHNNLILLPLFNLLLEGTEARCLWEHLHHHIFSHPHLA